MNQPMISRATRGAARFAGSAALRAGLRAVPYIGAAYDAYEIGRGMYNRWRRRPERRRVKGRIYSGYNAGKFKKPKRVKSKDSVYGNKGIYQTYEIHGRVNDPDCVYISHQSVDGYEVIDTAIQALMRKLFEKAGFRIASLTDLLTSTAITTSVSWRIQLTRLNAKTGAESVQVQYDTVAADTITSVALQFLPAFLEYAAGFTNTGAGNAGIDTQNPHRIILFRQDVNVTTGYVFETEIRLQEEILCVMGSSELKVQNRSLSSTGSADAEDVNNNPLVGRLYEFNSMPKIRNKGAFPLMSIPVDKGVQLVRGASFPDPAWKEPPVPSVFSNVKKHSKVSLPPGGIKTTKISYKKHMNFLTFLQKIRLQYGTGVEFLATYSIFPLQIIALEDMINVNAVEKINVAYEANKTLGVYFKTMSKRTAVTEFKTLEWNNFT